MLRTSWLDVSYHAGTEYLVIVDRFSHYPWVRESPTCDTEAIIKILSSNKVPPNISNDPTKGSRISTSFRILYTI